MELIKYLNDNFFTTQELLDASKVSEQELTRYQEKGVMPKSSSAGVTIVPDMPAGFTTDCSTLGSIFS